MSNKKEIWKDIKGFEKLYQVSNKGRVKSLVRKGRLNERILKNMIGTKNYLQVSIYKNKKLRTIKVHRLVAETFIPNPENKPQVNHKKGNKKDNRAWMLEWVTTLENSDHAKLHNLKRVAKGEKCGQSKLTNKQIIKIRLLKDKKSISDLSKLFKVTKQNIRYIINNKTWKHI